MIQATECLPREVESNQDLAASSQSTTRPIGYPKIAEVTRGSVEILAIALTFPLWPIAILMHIVASLDDGDDGKDRMSGDNNDCTSRGLMGSNQSG